MVGHPQRLLGCSECLDRHIRLDPTLQARTVPIDGCGLLGIKAGDLGLKAVVGGFPHQRSSQG
jgi:hypothetical protein